MASKKKQEEARQEAPRDELKTAPEKKTARTKAAKEDTPREEKGKKEEKAEKKAEKQEQKTEVKAGKTAEKPVGKTEEKQESKAETKTEAKAKAKAETEKKTEAKAEEGQEAKAERKPREPQMVTVNGQKVTHAHAFQSNNNPDTWYFTARLDGQQLRPMRMHADDLAAYQKKETNVEQLMQTYYPSKLAPKVSPEQYAADNKLSDGRTVDKMNVYKENDQNRPDFGRYKLYAVVGDQKMSKEMSYADLNAFFDRTTTPAKLVEKNFGEQLHLKSHYEQFKLPEGAEVKAVRVAKEKNSNRWNISVDMGPLGITPKKPLEYNDGYALFHAKTATREQLAAKYLTPEIKGLMAAPKQEQSVSMKR